ncbi:MAG: glycosyltransferase family 39 protein, partial [Planctomycetes bacterium]|nr:glycosyltransferase family 39 protein [Planctomycetota bacterium]
MLWIALLLALALRAGLLLLYPYLPGLGDESLHYVMAVLVEQLGHGVMGHWGPGYEVFLASIFSAAGPDPWAAKAVQVFVSTASVLLIWAIAYRAGGQRAGRIAAFLAAVYPSLVAYATYLYSETLFLALILAGMTALFGLSGERTRLRCVVAGIFFGLATLTRSLVLYFLPVWIVWALLRGRRREAAEAALVLLVMLALLLPWTARNWSRYDGFLLVDGTVAQTSYIAFSEVLFSTDLGFDHWRSQLPRSRPRCPFEPVPDLEPLPPLRETMGFFPPPATSVVKSDRRLAARLAEVNRLSTLDFPRMQRCEVSRAIEFGIQNPGIIGTQMLRRFYAFW